MFHCSCAGPGRRAPHAKYAVTLLGPSTRLLEPCAAVDDVFRALGDRGQNRSRLVLARDLAGFAEIPVRTGQIVCFSWGEDDSPVHSEPDSSSSDRIFLSVLFGSEDELRGMCRMRRKVYGRQTLS